MPYRNSLMTMVLRDSLGGNCRTVMVATINSEQAQVLGRAAVWGFEHEPMRPAAVLSPSIIFA